MTITLLCYYYYIARTLLLHYYNVTIAIIAAGTPTALAEQYYKLYSFRNVLITTISIRIIVITLDYIKLPYVTLTPYVCIYIYIYT